MFEQILHGHNLLENNRRSDLMYFLSSSFLLIKMIHNASYAHLINIHNTVFLEKMLHPFFRTLQYVIINI